MAVFKSVDTSSSIVGSPFNGALSGTSVTISSTVVRGSTTMCGTIKKFSGYGVYTPLDQRVNLVGDRTIKFVLPEFPTLPVVPPTTLHLKQEPIKISTYAATTGSSFTAPTISGTVVRPSNTESATLTYYAYSPFMTDAGNYVGRGINYWNELSIFGMINHRLFMDY